MDSKYHWNNLTSICSTNSLVGFSLLGNFQVRILEWVGIHYSKTSSWPMGWTYVSVSTALADRFFTTTPSGQLPVRYLETVLFFLLVNSHIPMKRLTLRVGLGNFWIDPCLFLYPILIFKEIFQYFIFWSESWSNDLSLVTTLYHDFTFVLSSFY